MISMTYSCRCGFRTPDLSTAQHHADSKQHTVDLYGTITPQKPPKAEIEQIEKAARERALNSEILRAARDRGLIKGVRR